MNQLGFEAACQSDWQKYDDIIGKVQKIRRGLPTEELYELPTLYQKICNHYALALERSYSPGLLSDLHERVYRGHTLLYRKKGQFRWRFIQFLFSRFPWQLRQQAGYFLVATLLFLLPAIVMGVACTRNSDMIYSVLPAGQVSSMEEMYDPSNKHLGRSKDRASDTDIQMFGFYILNNISIGFRTFAMGILLGIGTVFALVFNGLVIGGVAGHLTGIGYTETFWSFVSGHGSFELTAIVICGAAGLRLARPLLAPGRFTRAHGLKVAGRESVELVMGAAFMLLVAAFIEAFWSSSTYVRYEIKYAVAGFLWLIVFLWLAYAGKNRLAH